MAGVLPALGLVLILFDFQSLLALRLRFGTSWVVGWCASIDIVEIRQYFPAASYDFTFLSRSLNVQESSIWETSVVLMHSSR